ARRAPSEPARRAPSEPARRPQPEPARRGPSEPARRGAQEVRRSLGTPPPSPRSAAPRGSASGGPRRSATPAPPAPAAQMWPRRTAACRKALERIPEGAPAEELARPIALLLRDAASRIYLTAALASDHENLDLMEALEPAASDAIASDTRVAMERLRREAS